MKKELYHINIENRYADGDVRRADVYVMCYSKEEAHEMAAMTRRLIFGNESNAMIDVAWITYEAAKIKHLEVGI
jgi:hypothetical protein